MKQKMIAFDKDQAMRIIDSYDFTFPLMFIPRKIVKYKIDKDKFEAFIKRERPLSICHNLKKNTSIIYSWKNRGFLTQQNLDELTKFYKKEEFL